MAWSAEYQKAYMRAYYLANKERALEQQRERRAANPEAIAEYQREYRQANREKLREYDATYREANREKARAYAAAYYVENLETFQAYRKRPEVLARNRSRVVTPEARARASEQSKIRYAATRDEKNAIRRAKYAERREQILSANTKWRRDNPELYKHVQAAAGLKRKAAKMGTAHPAASRDEIMTLPTVCQNCDGPAEHLDHIWPLSRGGCSALHNLQWLCERCNLQKGAKTLDEWLNP